MVRPGDHLARLGDLDFWGPHIEKILERHELAEPGEELIAGFNPTYPTFISGGVVVKLFGGSPSWRRTHTAERAAHRVVATDPEIAAPKLLAEGHLSDQPGAPWPYLITTRMAGTASWRAELSIEQRQALAIALGRQVRRIHALAPAGAALDVDWQPESITAAAEQSSLPSHLVAQVDAYLARLDTFDRVFTHGDLTANHVFVDEGRFAGIIDWGDAMVADRHYELIQVFRDMLGCDKALFQRFLEASDWPVGKDFAQRALGLALHRQAVGLSQHHSMDVFEPIAALLPLEDIATLDDLATELFAV